MPVELLVGLSDDQTPQAQQRPWKMAGAVSRPDIVPPPAPVVAPKKPISGRDASLLASTVAGPSRPSVDGLDRSRQPSPTSRGQGPKAQSSLPRGTPAGDKGRSRSPSLRRPSLGLFVPSSSTEQAGRGRATVPRTWTSEEPAGLVHGGARQRSVSPQSRAEARASAPDPLLSQRRDGSVSSGSSSNAARTAGTSTIASSNAANSSTCCKPAQSSTKQSISSTSPPKGKRSVSPRPGQSAATRVVPSASPLRGLKPLLRAFQCPKISSMQASRSSMRRGEASQGKGTLAGRRERAAVMEGTVVPSSARPVKPHVSQSPAEILKSASSQGRGPESVKTVRVKKGDTLATVAREYRMRIRDLQRLNGLKSDYIIEGDILTVATGWIWRSMTPDIRPGLRRTLRPLFSRIPVASLPPPSSPRQGLTPSRVPKALGVGGPLASRKSMSLLEGKWKRAPKGFSKGNEEWLRFASPLVDGFVSSSFGWRWGAFHEGVDLAAESGSPILASDRGIVTFSGWSGGYGKLVTIAHDGGFSTRYGHCSVLSARVGQRVSRGQKVACVGSTGRATGPHVHFEVRRNGEALDPFRWCDL